MPIYEFVCDECNEQFEVLTTLSKASEICCPKCGSGNLRRLMSTFAAKTAPEPSFAGCESCEAGYGGAPACGCVGHCHH